MAFAKGDHETAVRIGSMGGRPPGAKSRPWATLDYWIEKVENEWEHLSEKDRAYIAMEGFKTLLKLRPLPPGTPEESVKNVEQAMTMIKSLEQKTAPEAKIDA